MNASKRTGRSSHTNYLCCHRLRSDSLRCSQYTAHQVCTRMHSAEGPGPLSRWRNGLVPCISPHVGPPVCKAQEGCLTTHRTHAGLFSQCQRVDFRVRPPSFKSCSVGCGWSSMVECLSSMYEVLGSKLQHRKKKKPKEQQKNPIPGHLLAPCDPEWLT
jgi:hypothetical protein